MVNVENINKVIEVIRDESNFFDMGWYVIELSMKRRYAAMGQPIKEPCGSPACIGGWANHLGGEKLNSAMDAAMFLGISDWQSQDLFGPVHKSLNTISRAEAIATLERLRDTGEVIW